MLHKAPMLHKPAGRTVRWVAAAAAAVIVAMLASTRMAAAVQPSKLATKTFLPTGAEQTYKVPAGVRTVRITAVGGTGGGNLSGLFSLERPGRGAVVTAPVGVSPRSTLYVEVGAGGGHSTQAPGGGASFVQTCPSTSSQPFCPALSGVTYLVAGGGGGAGVETLDFCCDAHGGDAGMPGKPQPGDSNFISRFDGTGGGAATISAGGAGGAGGDAFDPHFGSPGSAGGAGEPLNGGTGGSGGGGIGGPGRGGGGGGGGWYGGGGGGGSGSGGATEGGGGGGGSSFISLVNAAEVGLDDFANPRVEITPVTVTSTRVTCTTPVPAGSPARCTASVPNQTTGFPVATGTVTWSVTSGSGTFNRQSCALNDSGRCSVAFRPELGAPMTLTIRAEYGGDTNHLASSGTRDIEVNVP